MTPREKEIALEAAGRSVDPVAHAKKLIEAAAFLHGERPPFVCWPTRQVDLAELAAWHEAQAAEARRNIAYLGAVAEWRKQNPVGFAPPIEGLLSAEEPDLQSATRAADGQPVWRLEKEGELEINPPAEAEQQDAGQPEQVPECLEPMFAAMREIVETGEGVRGNKLDRKLTLRELLDGALRDPAFLGSGETSPESLPASADSASPVPSRRVLLKAPRPSAWKALSGRAWLAVLGLLIGLGISAAAFVFALLGGFPGAGI